MFVKQRDFVHKKKFWDNFPEPDSSILHLKSVEHESCPIRSSHIRANTVITTFYIKTISINPPVTKFYFVGQNDVKGSIPTFVINMIASKNPKRFVDQLIIGCGMVKSKGK